MHDFIVVGSGPAGSCLARRLADSKGTPKVLLLEAGPPVDGTNANILAERWTSFMQYPDNNWGYDTVPQKHADNRTINYSRGKGLGGSTSINMCAWTVGPQDDYDEWANLVGDSSFSWGNAVRLRKKHESVDSNLSESHRKYARPDMSVHGTDGPVRIEYAKVLEAPMTAQLDAAKHVGLGVNLDINSGNPLGLASCPATSRSGRRITSAEAFLTNVPSNLTIITNAQVTKVIFEGARATGVLAGGWEYLASKEVILSAGAVDTPKILLLSGVGPKNDLAELGIPCVHNLSGVGNSLEDHYFTSAMWEEKENLRGWNTFYGDSAKVKAGYEQFAKDGTGPLSIFFATTAIGFFKADEVLDSQEFADLPKQAQEHIKRPTVPLWEMSCWIPPFSPLADPKLSYLTVAFFLHCPQSRGTIKLASADPEDAPLVDPNFFSHPFDRRCAIAATRRVLDFVGTPKMSENIKQPFLVPGRTDEEILSFWQQYGISTWHPSCTVKMGKADDPDACLDTDFRVRGLQNLRVADMSATPFLPNCHTQACAYFIGECAAEKIIAEHKLDA
ncbi:hypothetical protein BAUCODRAFT_525959 [Baudoinia panamericana UAMH 10762]|uniref:Glucose-methanol-choline oxidoreductase N-terminal domain-containing protein n=1 Tax=Baudoinia panamericana (strain UAMH 10762) TaxID=717646 RepID=M2LLF5_BAUPA|nr:uncharacterized protein BAUCODRAFT_525959 [Baudoinia panamericana UAMH 10762]EMC95107.1 hypothetical protein BAUCODRAFT_525959 [Baudoinia panamericana UAMH 10762]